MIILTYSLIIFLTHIVFQSCLTEYKLGFNSGKLHLNNRIAKRKQIVHNHFIPHYITVFDFRYYPASGTIDVVVISLLLLNFPPVCEGDLAIFLKYSVKEVEVHCLPSSDLKCWIYPLFVV